MSDPLPSKMEPRIVRKLRAKFSAQNRRALDAARKAEAMLAALKLECGHPNLKIKREWWGVWAHCPDCFAGRDDLEAIGIDGRKLEAMLEAKLEAKGE